MPEVTQLPLGLRWPAWQRFEHFEAGANALALAACRQLASASAASWLLLSGPHGSGKTHLLLATCQEASQGGQVAQYLGLAGLADAAAVIRGQGGGALAALDDVDAIAGDRAAEHALFDLYNRCRADGTRLLLAATPPLAGLGIGLPDLASRLGAMTQLGLQPLDEAARRELLRRRAARRGIELDDHVLDWLFRNQSRDLGSLSALLDRVDVAALAARRRVTVPFLRELLARPPG